MTIARSAILAITLSAAAAMPAVAQPAAGPTTAPGIARTPATMSARPIEPSGPTGSLQKTHDAWRAGQLVGATVFNQDGASIGTIDNLLIGSDGKVSQAVLSVGGFLGVGSKLVAVPFDQLKFEQSRGIAVATTVPAGGAGMASNVNAGTPGAVGAAPAANGATSAGPLAARAPMVREANAPEYFSVVMPGATKDSLTSMQAFRYDG